MHTQVESRGMISLLGERRKVRNFRHCRFIVQLSAAVLTGAALTGTAADETTSVGAVREALKRAVTFMRSISTEGGYVYMYSLDLQKREWENKTTNFTEIAIQPPGTPAMGSAFLRAYTATRDPFYLETARTTAMALVRCQLQSGGWHYTADFDPARPNVDGAVYGNTNNWVYGQFIKYEKATMFDDNTTQGAVNFLLDFSAQTVNSGNAEDEVIRQALDRALSDGMIGAQYPNGGWPQIYRGKHHSNTNFYNTTLYPVTEAVIPTNYPRTWPGLTSNYDYTPYYTQNDNGQSDCIKTMFKAWDILGKPEYLESAKRGTDFFLLAQLPAPQQAWAQQYNFNMEPAWARSHEAPAVCSCESGAAILSLLDAYKRNTNEVRYLEAVSNAVVWLNEARIGTNLWSRLYELGLQNGTNRPIYGDKSGTILTNPPDLSYNWLNSYDIPKAIARYERTRDGVPDPLPTVNLSKLRTDALAAAGSLDSTGRWITNYCFAGETEPEDAVSTQLFNKNVGVLVSYLNAVKSFAMTGSVADNNGTVSPAVTNVFAGGSADFVITASAYYRIASLTTNGAEVGIFFANDSTVTNFIWSNVQSDGGLVASFAPQVTLDPASTPYEWLAQHGLTDFNTDAMTDTDGDGLLCWQEYIAGTDPTNPASSFRIAAGSTNSYGGTVLRWPSAANRFYSLSRTTNLMGAFIAIPEADNLPATPPENVYTDPLRGGGPAFYKINVHK